MSYNVWLTDGALPCKRFPRHIDRKLWDKERAVLQNFRTESSPDPLTFLIKHKAMS